MIIWSIVVRTMRQHSYIQTSEKFKAKRTGKEMIDVNRKGKWISNSIKLQWADSATTERALDWVVMVLGNEIRSCVG